MKPFNLQAALSGAPVQTRDGRPVKIAGHNGAANEPNVVAGWMNGRVYGWYVNGKMVIHDTTDDLFMAPEKKIGWINVYPKNAYHPDSVSAFLWNSEEEARCNANEPGAIAVKIEWEI